MAQWQIIFFQTPCPQTLSQLMFNKFKQDCSDIKAIASRQSISMYMDVHIDIFKVVRIWMQAKVNSM